MGMAVFDKPCQSVILIMSFGSGIELKGFYIQGQPSARRVAFLFSLFGSMFQLLTPDVFLYL